MYLKLNTIPSPEISYHFVLVLFSFKNKKYAPVSQEGKEAKSDRIMQVKIYPEQSLDARIWLAGNLFEQIAMLFRVCPGIFIMAGTAGIKAERH